MLLQLTLWLLGVSAGYLVGSCLLPGVRRLQHVRSDLDRWLAVLSRQLLRPDSDYNSLQTQTHSAETEGWVTPEPLETWSAFFKPGRKVLLDQFLKSSSELVIFTGDQSFSVSIIGYFGLNSHHLELKRQISHVTSRWQHLLPEEAEGASTLVQTHRLINWSMNLTQTRPAAVP